MEVSAEVAGNNVILHIVVPMAAVAAQEVGPSQETGKILASQPKMPSLQENPVPDPVIPQTGQQAPNVLTPSQGNTPAAQGSFQLPPAATSQQAPTAAPGPVGGRSEVLAQKWFDLNEGTIPNALSANANFRTDVVKAIRAQGGDNIGQDSTSEISFLSTSGLQDAISAVIMTNNAYRALC